MWSETNITPISETICQEKICQYLSTCCFAGYTLFAYLNILTAPGSKFTGYISSMVRDSPGYYGAALFGYNSKMQFVSFILNYSFVLLKSWSNWKKIPLKLSSKIIDIFLFNYALNQF